MKNRFSVLSFLLFVVVFIMPFFLYAQQSDIEMADTMRANGKIYVVVAVVSVIIAGLLVFLMIIDRNVRRLEREKAKNPDH